MLLFDDTPDFDSLPDCKLELHRSWICRAEAMQLFTELREKTKWELRQIFMYGKWVNQPRLTALYGDQGLEYKYTGSEWKTESWLPCMVPLKERIEQQFGIRINAVLCNHYRSGADYCGWHTDFGKTDGPNPQIFSLSLGATRPFQIKHTRIDPDKVITIQLQRGDLLYMGGEMQKHWKHQLPKVVGRDGERINLTFRSVAEPKGLNAARVKS